MSWKEPVVAYLKVLTRHSLLEAMSTMKTFSQDNW